MAYRFYGWGLEELSHWYRCDWSDGLPPPSHVFFNPDYWCKETGKHNHTLIQQYGIGPHRVVSTYTSATSGLGYNLALTWKRLKIVEGKIVEEERSGINRVLACRCIIKPLEMVEIEDML